MSALICEVRQGSIADELGIKAGDILVRIDGRKVMDILDYQFFSVDEEVEIEIEKPDGQMEIIEIEKDAGESLGLGFDRVIFNRMKKCANQCLFCFVDQLPPGMRRSLYFKDDDYRLSFLYGNFISLTNLSAADRKKIYAMKLSPLYVSVHSMDASIRSEIMGSSKAALIAGEIEKLQEHGISIHAQIVLCPGINDGTSLYNSIEKLAFYYPAVLSIGIVPVGITRCNSRLDRIRPVSRQEAHTLIKRVEVYQKQFRKKLGCGFVYLADEFYIKAGLEFPDAEYYDDFCQLENGIGFCRMLLDDFQAMEGDLPEELPEREIFLTTGISAAGVLKRIASRLNQVKGLHVEVLPVVNHFFGEQITVTGLLTGVDILQALGSGYSGKTVILPEVLLKEGELVFLDGMTVDELARQSGAAIVITDGSAAGLIESALNS